MQNMKNLGLSTRSITTVLLLAMLVCVGLWSSQAMAHKEHAGSIVDFLKTNEVLKVLLPGQAKLVKRKEMLSPSAVSWAKTTLGINLDNQVHTYYRANDHDSGQLLGGAIILKYPYRHGEVVLMAGIDAQQHLTGVAIQGISEKYIADFEGAFTLGLLPDYAGKTVQDLAQIAASPAADKPTRFINSKLAETAAMIAAFLQGADSQ